MFRHRVAATWNVWRGQPKEIAIVGDERFVDLGVLVVLVVLVVEYRSLLFIFASRRPTPVQLWLQLTSGAMPSASTNTAAASSAATTSTFLGACRRQPVGHTPVWFMRQAGRSLPEYQAVRGEGSIMHAISQPDLVTEITLQPVRRYGVDAAILYSDIMVPLVGIGFGVDVVQGIGPVVAEPFRDIADLKRLRPLEPEADTPYVQEAIRQLIGELAVPLIGFAGAPFTLAAYLIEGGPSKNYARTKALMFGRPDVWDALVGRLADIVIASLRSQVAAGCQAVQLFDSWAGSLSPADYQRHVLPASRRIFHALADLDVPRIHFGVGTGELLGLMANAGADVVGVDWRVSPADARQRVGPDRALQGNLDPAVCLAPWDVVQTHADRILAEAGPIGHIFNLGHGVLPETNPDILARLVEHVHQFERHG